MDPLGISGHVLDDKYAIDEAVAEGGFSTVYRAMHLVLKRPVALKVFHAAAHFTDAEREHLVERFIKEAALLEELSERTAAICQARDVGTLTTQAGALPYMVLEWLEGRSLESLLEEEQFKDVPPRSLEEVVSWLAPIAEALAVAHQRNIVHKDVKPSNIFILSESNKLKLLDFGIAQIVQENQEPFARTGRRSSFTPAYGAPEQFSTELGATGPWTDVYCFALVLTELVTGKPPLAGRTVAELGNATLDPQKRPTPRTYGAKISEGAEAVFRKALAIEPRQRYATVGEMWQALVQVAVDVELDRDRVRPLSALAVPAPPKIASVRPMAKSEPPPPAPKKEPEDDRTTRRVELGLAALGVIVTVVSGVLLLLEGYGYKQYLDQASYHETTCIIESVHADGSDRIVVVHTHAPRSQQRDDVRESETSDPTFGFGGADAQPATYTRLVGAEVPCYQSTNGIVLRRWSRFAMWPLALLAIVCASAFFATRWMFARLKSR